MNRKGFSLLELVVAMSIVVILSLLGLRSMAQGQQRETLLKVTNQALDLLRRAQSDAKLYGELRGVCFKRDEATQKNSMALYKPELAAGSTLPSDLDCADATEKNTGSVVDFGSSVVLCRTCDPKVEFNQSIFFDKDGYTMRSDGQREVFEICVINTELPAGTRAREIEVGINGDIQLLAQTAQGLYNGVVANQGNCQ